MQRRDLRDLKGLGLLVASRTGVTRKSHAKQRVISVIHVSQRPTIES